MTVLFIAVFISLRSDRARFLLCASASRVIPGYLPVSVCSILCLSSASCVCHHTPLWGVSKSLPLRLAFTDGGVPMSGCGKVPQTERHQMIQSDVDRIAHWWRETSDFYPADILSNILMDETVLWRVVESWEIGMHGAPWEDFKPVTAAKL